MKIALVFAVVATAIFALIIGFAANAIGGVKMDNISVAIASAVFFILMVVIGANSKKLKK